MSGTILLVIILGVKHFCFTYINLYKKYLQIRFQVGNIYEHVLKNMIRMFRCQNENEHQENIA